jgi:hypothetical protein
MVARATVPMENGTPRGQQVGDEYISKERGKGSIKKEESLRKGILGKNITSMQNDMHTHMATPTDSDSTNSLQSSSDIGWARDDLTPRQLAGVASSRRSPKGPYASTTDEDDALSFFRPSASTSVQPQPSPTLLLQRRRPSRSSIAHTSPIIVQTPVDLIMDDEWDYSETEWWGWVILIVTWIVFVVGMGSCFDVWSWAWDVGETPYAPPELEDDPTLPITGYYPALMVCTVVMAWIWVVVAWVGMKYFRHAKVVADDG